MAALLSSSSLASLRSPTQPPSFPILNLPVPTSLYPPRPLGRLRSSRRPPKGDVVVFRDGRPCRELQSLGEERDCDTDDEGEEDDDDRSLDLLVRFIQNVFRKVSKRARRAVRSVLPAPIPTRLVGFAVNGVLLLAFLWILKAFLEVICTIGSVVFISILLLRGALFGFSYLQETRWDLRNRFDGDDDEWSRVQPAT